MVWSVTSAIGASAHGSWYGNSVLCLTVSRQLSPRQAVSPTTHMCTVENGNDLCKGLLEAASGVMVPVAESCGRDAQVSARGGTQKKQRSDKKLIQHNNDVVYDC